MKICKIGLIVAILLACKVSMASIVPFLSERDAIDVKDWKFLKGDKFKAQLAETNVSSWENVSVPHTFSNDAITEVGYYQGMAWYRTNVDGKAFSKNRRVFIRFEGVGQQAIVYLNGKKKGSHSGSYSAFVVELTDGWDYDGDNLIAVRVDNTTSSNIIPVSNFLFNLYGGIYRPVALFSTPKVCIAPNYYASSGVFVEATSIKADAAEVQVRVNLSGTDEAVSKKLKVQLKNKAGEVVATKEKEVSVSVEKQVETFNLTVSDPVLWNGTINPHLYSALVSLSGQNETDNVAVDFGIRSFDVTAEHGFSLNGKPYKVNGVCRHQEWEQYANALTKREHKADMDMIREMGATGLRLAHYQQADYMYQLADEYGIVVWAEIPRVHAWTGNEHVNSMQQLTELILQNYNHPSICFWGLFNEVRAHDKKDAPCVKLTHELNQLAHKLDQTRLTTSATDRPMGEPMNGISDLQGWNKYFGWYGNDPYKEIGNFFDQIHKEYPELRISVSEYGAGANIEHQDITKSEKPLGDYFPEQAQTTCHEEAWNEIRQRDYIWGSFLWNMFDFGVNQWFRGGVNHLNHKGLITFDRKVKKDAFYFYKANWNPEPMLYLTERRNVNRTIRCVNVKAYCNLPVGIELTVNGEKLGKAKANDIKIVRWENITLKEGRNVVKVSCKYNDEMFTDTVVWDYTPEEQE